MSETVIKNAAKRSRQHARIQRRLSSNERTHTRGGRTHNVTQRTDTHIFTGGGRIHNVTQRTDTQIFFVEAINEYMVRSAIIESK